MDEFEPTVLPPPSPSFLAELTLACDSGALASPPTRRGPSGPPRVSARNSIQRFFAERFGRALVIGALGQTAVHDRPGFDHRNALDVSGHPDSAEGPALVAWLRRHGVPFLGLRGPVRGTATGPHVHIGEPSPDRAG